MTNFPTFLKDIDELGWGVASFNTYSQNGHTHCFILVAEKGGSGRFIKSEGRIEFVDSMLLNLYLVIMKLYGESEVTI